MNRSHYLRGSIATFIIGVSLVACGETDHAGEPPPIEMTSEIGSTIDELPINEVQIIELIPEAELPSSVATPKPVIMITESIIENLPDQDVEPSFISRTWIQKECSCESRSTVWTQRWGEEPVNHGCVPYDPDGPNYVRSITICGYDFE